MSASSDSNPRAPYPDDPDAKKRLADQLQGRDWRGIVRFLCERDGIEFRDGLLTSALGELRFEGEGARGMAWSRRRSWAEELVLGRVVRVAQRLEETARIAGAGVGIPSLSATVRTGVEPQALPPLPNTVDGAFRETWKEVLQLADVASQALRALAERDEQQRLLSALRSIAKSRTPTRAILVFLKHRHGVVEEERLRELLTDLDLHEIPPPWDRLDRAQLVDGRLHVRSRGRSGKKWPPPKWSQVRTVARKIGLLEAS